MLEAILKTIGITSPILILCATGIYLLLQKLINDKFEVIKSENVEKMKQYLKKDMTLFEKKKEGLSNILKLTSQILTKIKSHCNYMDGGYYLISEEECDNYEIQISEHILYVDDTTTDILDLIVKILRKNSDFMEKITGDYGGYFLYEDLVMLEYIYQRLVQIFRKQLFDKADEINADEIKLMEIAFIIKHFVDLREIERKEVEPFDYSRQTIMDAIFQIRNSKKEVIKLLENIILKYEKGESKSEYNFRYIQKAKEYVAFMKGI